MAKVIFLNGQVSHLILTQLSCFSLKTKLKTERLKNKQQLKIAAVEVLQSLLREETQRLMSMGARLQAVINCKTFVFKYYKIVLIFTIMLARPITLSLLKMEELHVKKSIST